MLYLSLQADDHSVRQLSSSLQQEEIRHGQRRQEELKEATNNIPYFFLEERQRLVRQLHNENLKFYQDSPDREREKERERERERERKIIKNPLTLRH